MGREPQARNARARLSQRVIPTARSGAAGQSAKPWRLRLPAASRASVSLAPLRIVPDGRGHRHAPRLGGPAHQACSEPYHLERQAPERGRVTQLRQGPCNRHGSFTVARTSAARQGQVVSRTSRAAPWSNGNQRGGGSPNSDKTHATWHGGAGGGTGRVGVGPDAVPGERHGSPNAEKTHATWHGGARGGTGAVDVRLDASPGERHGSPNSDATHATWHGGAVGGTGRVDVRLDASPGERHGSPNSDATHATWHGGAGGGTGAVDVGLDAAPSGRLGSPARTRPMQRGTVMPAAGREGWMSGRTLSSARATDRQSGQDPCTVARWWRRRDETGRISAQTRPPARATDRQRGQDPYNEPRWHRARHRKRAYRPAPPWPTPRHPL